MWGAPSRERGLGRDDSLPSAEGCLGTKSSAPKEDLDGSPQPPPQLQLRRATGQLTHAGAYIGVLNKHKALVAVIPTVVLLGLSICSFN